MSSTVFAWRSTAAQTRCPPASTQAAASPVAAFASTTAGGGTRSGASATATTCATGRKTYSHRSSRPCRGFRAMLQPMDWPEIDGALEKEFELESFPAAIAFVDRLAEVAEAENHHPDIDIRYRRVRVRWSTHSAGGVTDKDRELAARTDELV